MTSWHHHRHRMWLTCMRWARGPRLAPDTCYQCRTDHRWTWPPPSPGGWSWSSLTFSFFCRAYFCILPVSILVWPPRGWGDQLLGLGVSLLVNIPDALGLGQAGGVVPVRLGVGVTRRGCGDQIVGADLLNKAQDGLGLSLHHRGISEGLRQ